MEFKLPLPCTASDVERFIHIHCDTHGFTNCHVSSDGQNLILRYAESDYPQITPAMTSSTEGLRRVVC